ncbi:hypothetical protein [Neomoorella glycerini]|nr:hypothetical protein [Moorella glycerini]
MLKEIIAQVEEARVGRAVAGLMSAGYRFQVVQPVDNNNFML